MFERRFIESSVEAKRETEAASRCGSAARASPDVRVRDRLRQTDVDIQPERRRDLVLKELSQAAMLRIDAAQQLAFVEPEAEGVIRLPRAWLPRRLLASEHDARRSRSATTLAIDRLVEREQRRPGGPGVANGDALLALLRELRPVRAHPLVVVEPAARMGEGQRHRGQALGGRVDEDHGVLLPRLARLLVADAAPEIDDLLAPVVRAAGAAQLAASREVLRKGVAHAFEAGTDVSFNGDARALPYSARRARTGSTPATRRAGTAPAASAIRTTPPNAHASITGSVVVTPYRRPLCSRGTR